MMGWFVGGTNVLVLLLAFEHRLSSFEKDLFKMLSLGRLR